MNFPFAHRVTEFLISPRHRGRCPFFPTQGDESGLKYHKLVSRTMTRLSLASGDEAERRQATVKRGCRGGWEGAGGGGDWGKCEWRWSVSVEGSVLSVGGDVRRVLRGKHRCPGHIMSPPKR